MKKEIICTVCPRGCHINVEGEGDTVSLMEGYGCKRGEEYARNEFTHPVRILTTTMKISGRRNELLPVRSGKPLPKEKLFDCMKVIRAAEVSLPVEPYQVLISDICHTGVDIVATKEEK